MDINIDQTTDKVNIFVGRAVSSLIVSGKRVDKISILEQLKYSEKQAVDGMKNVYAEAIGLVTGSTIASID